MRVALLLACLALPWARADIDPATVVVVSVRGDAGSAEIAAAYAKLRGIPSANRIELEIPATEREVVAWARYSQLILNPLREELLRRRLVSGSLGETVDDRGRRPLRLDANPRVRWIVLCHGLPWRIRRDAGANGQPQGPAPASEAASVDSELCLLATEDGDPSGPRPNPWFRSLPGKEPRGTERLLRTARLDGPTPAAVLRMLAETTETERRGLRGRAYVDRGGPYPEGDSWFALAAEVCLSLGLPTDIETSKELIGPDARFDAPAIYLGWYSGAPKGKLAETEARLAPGAIALHLHSFSGQALRNPKSGWTAALVERGAALTFGNVDEPYLTFTVRPDVLLGALALGGTAGEAAWQATPAMSWMGVIVGDPLYRPFARDLKEQVADFFGRQADPLGPYAVLRGANRVGDQAEARRQMLVAAVLRQPRLALLLAVSEDAVAAGKPFGWDNRQLRQLAQEDFGLVLAAARFLKAQGKAAQAAELYREVLRRIPPDSARAKALQAEAAR